MSTTLLWAGSALVVSSLALVPLALRDPKRLRAAESEVLLPLSRRQRGALACAVLLPGAVLVLSARWPAFLIWFGSVAAVGWALALAFVPRPPRHHR